MVRRSLAACALLVALTACGGGPACPDGETRVETGQTLVMIPQYNAASKTTTLMQVWQIEYDCVPES